MGIFWKFGIKFTRDVKFDLILTYIDHYQTNYFSPFYFFFLYLGLYKDILAVLNRISISSCAFLGQVSFCHHLASFVSPNVGNFSQFSLPSLIPLGQIEPNFTGRLYIRYFIAQFVNKHCRYRQFLFLIGCSN